MDAEQRLCSISAGTSAGTGTKASIFGGRFCLLNNVKAEDLNKHIGLNKNSSILLFNTEGDTDKDSFLNIIKKHQ